MVATVIKDKMSANKRSTLAPAASGNGHHHGAEVASLHEYNMFMDKEIQKRLSQVSDYVAVKHLSDDCVANVFVNNVVKTTSKKSLKRAVKSAISSFTDLSAWSYDLTAARQNAGTDVTNSNNNNRKAFEKPPSRMSRDSYTSSTGWKEPRMRDIVFPFCHFADTKRYIEQYRYDHTYNVGPLGREPIDITTCKIVAVSSTNRPHVSAEASPPAPSVTPTTQQLQKLSPPNMTPSSLAQTPAISSHYLP